MYVGGVLAADSAGSEMGSSAAEVLSMTNLGRVSFEFGSGEEVLSLQGCEIFLVAVFLLLN